MSHYALLLVIAACAIGSQARVWNFDIPRPLTYAERSQQIINHVNYVAHTTWRAGFNDRFKDMDSVKRQLGAVKIPSGMKLPKGGATFEPGDYIPDFFDSRKRWPECPTIGEIRDQSDCGSGWAFGAVEAMSDRICIHSGGKKKVHLSAEDLMTCCAECVPGEGCQNGYPEKAWEFWVEKGIVSGGEYGSNEGCQPYPFPKCDHHTTGHLHPCPKKGYKTHKCQKSCEKGYNVTYKADKHFGKTHYGFTSNFTLMQLDIMKNGPVEATFDVYEDFLHYKSGIYQYESGLYVGRHSVKFVGWGKEKGTDYWIVANSWNRDWGENGYFRVLLGYEVCNIENHVMAGIPKL